MGVGNQCDDSMKAAFYSMSAFGKSITTSIIWKFWRYFPLALPNNFAIFTEIDKS